MCMRGCPCGSGEGGGSSEGRRQQGRTLAALHCSWRAHTFWDLPSPKVAPRCCCALCRYDFSCPGSVANPGCGVNGTPHDIAPRCNEDPRCRVMMYFPSGRDYLGGSLAARRRAALPFPSLAAWAGPRLGTRVPADRGCMCTAPQWAVLRLASIRQRPHVQHPGEPDHHNSARTPPGLSMCAVQVSPLPS